MKRLLCIGLLWTLGTLTHASQESPIWFWFATCGGPSMTLEVRVDSAVIQKASLPLCRAPRSSAASQGQDGRIEFTFSPRRAIMWSGYRDQSERSRAGQALEFNVWQAGADAGWLRLGVTVMTSDRILMNTVHIAHADKRDVSTLAEGLTLATYPTPR